MAKNRNNMLGVGGQRRKVSRADLRGAPPGGRGTGQTRADLKRTLAESMRERLNTQRVSTETTTPTEDATPAEGSGSDKGIPSAQVTTPAKDGTPADDGTPAKDATPGKGAGPGKDAGPAMGGSSA
ncbi:DUF6243 family protein [Spirillospora sp. NPDC049652]